MSIVHDRRPRPSLARADVAVVPSVSASTSASAPTSQNAIHARIHAACATAAGAPYATRIATIARPLPVSRYIGFRFA